MAKQILLPEEVWRNSQLSIARHYGGVTVNGEKYIIVNKEGKDLFECTHEANMLGRSVAIPAGEPADLIMAKYQKEYRKLGRNEFLRQHGLEALIKNDNGTES